ncbi:MAG: hypothetical protein PHH19_01230 [Eubacteriales bacterium]|nr:hypothetical protein [Eubacteriales bacterium]
MFGKNFVIELKFDTHDLLYIISDFLKSNGISHFNNIEGNKLRGYGDAGMGVFEIEKRVDRDKILKLFVEANSPVSADILENLIDAALEHIEENKLYERIVVIDEENEIEEIHEDQDKCLHDFQLVKEDELFGMEVNVYMCSKCQKIEFYKK